MRTTLSILLTLAALCAAAIVSTTTVQADAALTPSLLHGTWNGSVIAVKKGDGGEEVRKEKQLTLTFTKSGEVSAEVSGTTHKADYVIDGQAIVFRPRSKWVPSVRMSPVKLTSKKLSGSLRTVDPARMPGGYAVSMSLTRAR